MSTPIPDIVCIFCGAVAPIHPDSPGLFGDAACVPCTAERIARDAATRPLHGSNTIDAAVWQIAEGRETLAHVLASRSAAADRLSMDEAVNLSAQRFHGKAEAYERSMMLATRTADALVARLVKCGDNANSEEAADAFERAARIVAEMLGTTAAPAGMHRAFGIAAPAPIITERTR